MATDLQVAKRIVALDSEHAAEGDLAFGLVVKQGSAAKQVVVATGTSDVPIGVTVYDAVKATKNGADKYVQYDPVRVATRGSGNSVPVQVKKVIAASTGEQLDKGFAMKMVAGGYVSLETNGVKTATSICILDEAYTFPSTDAAGTIKVLMAVVI